MPIITPNVPTFLTKLLLSYPSSITYGPHSLVNLISNSVSNFKNDVESNPGIWLNIPTNISNYTKGINFLKTPITGKGN